jgi:hypothetical protein
MTMKHLVLALGLVFAGTSAIAQDASVTAAVPGGDHDCIKATDEKAMTSLGFTADQMTKVKEIQAAHKKECAGMEKASGEAKTAVADKHEEQLKAALPNEQYNKWVAWCTERSGKSEMKK